jgi:uncharacterized protein (TIGR02466 family)
VLTVAKKNKSSDTFSQEVYFPTMIYSSKLHDAEDINRELIKNIREEQEEDRKGIQRSNFANLGGWHSKNHLYKKKAFKDIANRVRQTAAKISEDCGYDPKFKLDIGTMWSIINSPGSFNRSHIHPGCLWSGVYYVQAPKNSGHIEFTEPRTQHLMDQANFAPDAKRPKQCWTKVRYEPLAGKMIIFPAWLYHAVMPNLAEEAKQEDAERIIISFNLSQYPVKK